MSTVLEPAEPLVANPHHAILRAAVSVGAASVVVKLAAVGKEIAVASAYGRSDSMDAFLVAALGSHSAGKSHL